ncbi:MAG: PAS domain-containing protein, partial [Planctomycetota bacterium]
MQCVEKSKEHYLKQELYALIQSGPEIFDFLQNGSLDGIWYWDLENPDEEWMSDRFWTVLGYTPEEKPHKASAWQDMIDPEDLLIASENLRRHAADPDYPYDQVVRYRHKEGHMVWVRCRGLAIRDENGVPRRMLGAHTDLTSLMRVEQSLVIANEKLRLRNDELQQFAYAASHDIRAPIRSLNSMLEVMQEDHSGQLDEAGRHILRLALKASRRVESLTKAVL